MSEGPHESFDPLSDPMAPPREPCECWCLHCRRTFMSTEMWFQRVINARDGFRGFWMCPTPNCSGAGFAFDIFPTDPTHPANEGWDDFDDDEFDDAFGDGAFGAETFDTPGTLAGEWDPAETKYREMDEFMDDEEEIAGEEWKYGLAPGESRPHDESASSRQAREAWEKEEERYNQPDERPRELDWSHQDDSISEDDIPF